MIFRVALIYILFSSVALGQVTVISPDESNRIQLSVDQEGRVHYTVSRDSKAVVLSSPLGFTFVDQPPIATNLEIVAEEKSQASEMWQPLWGESDLVRNRYRAASVWLKEKKEPYRRLRVDLRAYDDGVAFRVTIPEQVGFEGFELAEEITEFRFPADHTAWWIPDNWDTYEMLYTKSPLSEIGLETDERNTHTHEAHREDDLRGCNTPVTLQTRDGLYLALHEAELVDYAEMTLVVDEERPNTLVSNLVPWPDGVKVKGDGALITPWRTIQIAEKATDLIDSRLIENLNPPNRLGKVDTIRPMKLLGIWWSMHLGIETWGMEGGRHGATTENAKRYIDFAAENGLDGVLVEGWNTGWESWYQDDNFDFVTPYEDFDLEEVARYAKEKGVELVGHLETGGQIESFEKRMEEAFAQYQRLGITSVKTGYAGKIRPDGNVHHSQWMVNHYQKVVDTAARYGITLNVHEPIKPTGMRRTYPNLMTGEGVRGMEWNAWSRGNPPSHTVTIPFTRMLAGPLDYTPGIFDLNFERFADEYRFWNELDGLETRGRMHSTLARQLALFVVLYSPIQMASDLVENYEGHPAFQFIKDVPVSWNESRALAGEIGEFILMARRAGDDWFLGALTDETERTLELPLEFLDKGASYRVTAYRDANDAHFRDNPGAYEIETFSVKAGQVLNLRLAPGGGQALVLKKL